MKNCNSNHLHLIITMSAFLHVSPSYVHKYACLLLYTRSIIYPHPTKAIRSDPPLIPVENTYRNISHSFQQVSSSHSQAYSQEYCTISTKCSQFLEKTRPRWPINFVLI